MITLRPINWYDIGPGGIRYGVQIKVDGVWFNCLDGDTPLLFQEALDRDDWIAAQADQTLRRRGEQRSIRQRGEQQ